MLRRTMVLMVLGSACGGGGPSVGGKLRYTLDEMHIASVPIAEKTAILEAKNQLERARMEQGTHEAQLNDIKLQIDLAQNEEKQAKLAMESAKKEKEAADKSADRTRINNADRELRSSDLGIRASQAKVGYLRAQKEYLEKAIQWGKTAVFAKEARFELEKAKVASSRNIRPAGFNMSDFDKQNRERQDKAEHFKRDADGKKQEADRRRQDWDAKEKEHTSAKGQAVATPESGG
jgi:hypothetical protein